MTETFKMVEFERKKGDKYPLDIINEEVAKEVKSFHESFPMYTETPLREMKNLAKEIGLGSIYVKDESYRFGLNAFKVLGGSYAIGKYLADKLNCDISEMPYEKLISEEVREELGAMVFVTATDGNHGRGVAWTANQLKQKSVVYMPKGSAQERLDNIIAEGADASIQDMNYDEAVRLANKMAQEKGWVMVQDTAWEGYEDIPTWIIQGYSTMGYEANEQLKKLGENKPTHIFLQAGVGSMAAAITGLYSALYGEDRPIITIVEPNKADCLYRTAEANDGELRFVTGNMDTIMAGLACGEPCTIGWNILKDYADNFISCPDYTAAEGMRMLGNPPRGDERVISGESGAAPLGCVAEIMTNENLKWLREKLQLNENSKVLFFSTEGDTDKKNYYDVVWNGKYPSYEKKQF
ncbi:diaminopropionate ammonia-lyase [Tissierella sp. Yu-01]|uniref:diaminopropionate ammonia-lyase n=1 Tax=Tissierella sp. Yu-01 TaxID=3035694 RepID=UPI00240DA0DA|nr:diaminopropionate ammonia-lyase [Tissierella sp. Yu-01]WFA07772.1 diaminopropionate ammonia-lyase [Tissierella sp. Yu-01]